MKLRTVSNELTAIPFTPSENVIEKIEQTKNHIQLLWQDRSDHAIWHGYGIAEQFIDATSAQTYLHKIVSEVPASKEILRCFVALPFSKEQWGNQKRWFIPQWILKLTGSYWTGLYFADGHQDPNTQLLQYLSGESTTTQMKPIQVSDQFEFSNWETAINEIKYRINNKELRKVVLSRSENIPSTEEQSIERVFDRLVQENHSCFCFAMPTEMGWWVGASPEQLCKISGNNIFADALAGTVARGTDIKTDSDQSDILLASSKDRDEHQIVVDVIQNVFRKFCISINPIGNPTVLKSSTVIHLHTPISGVLNSDVTIDQLLAELHPTPAVGGDPSDAALSFISALEGQGRGYYAGIVGWIGYQNAEFAVSIRSALIQESIATLYAGVGVVAQSDARREWEETTWKMLPMRRALNPETLS